MKTRLIALTMALIFGGLLWSSTASQHHFQISPVPAGVDWTA
jgi:hypothetical protein